MKNSSICACIYNDIMNMPLIFACICNGSWACVSFLLVFTMVLEHACQLRLVFAMILKHGIIKINILLVFTMLYWFFAVFACPQIINFYCKNNIERNIGVVPKTLKSYQAIVNTSKILISLISCFKLIVNTSKSWHTLSRTIVNTSKNETHAQEPL